MIKTDKVVYRTRTLEEYDWLMKRLEEAVCKWYTGRKPTGLDIFYTYKSDTCIFVEDKKLTYTNSDSCKNELDYEIIEVSDLMENEIKTDKVIYHTKTQEEYDWLMEKLEEAGLMWAGGSSPTAPKQADNWRRYSTETCVNCEDERIVFGDFDFYKNESDYKDREIIEVSDLMENEKKTEILDKLEILNEHLEDKLKKIEEEEEDEDEDDDDESQKIKKIVYTTEVYFE